MSDTMNLNVRVSGTLKDYVNRAIRIGGYDNNSEYIRDLIRQDKARADKVAFERLKARLQQAFSAPEDDYVEISAEEFLARKQSKTCK